MSAHAFALTQILDLTAAANLRAYAPQDLAGMPLPSLHSPLFAPDYDPAIATGVDAMTSAALELFGD